MLAGTEHIERCGIIAIVGRPNVGKSTLLNHILGQRISITSRKPQTTRYHINGIHTLKQAQLIFVDTPGLQSKPRKLLDRYMNREVEVGLSGVDLSLYMLDARHWTAEDEHALASVVDRNVPIIAVLNKIDLVGDKSRLLAALEGLHARGSFAALVPVSARTGDGVDALLEEIVKRLPQRPAAYDAELFTDRSERFLASEIVREQLIRVLGEELPYRLTVLIDAFERHDELIRIHATIWVDRKGHKKIVIGRQGSRLKEIGIRARRNLESLFGAQVHLQTWVKVKENWTESAAALQELGFQ